MVARVKVRKTMNLIHQAKQDKEVLQLKRFFPIVFEWSEFISHINDMAQPDNPTRKGGSPNFLGRVNIEHFLTLLVEEASETNFHNFNHYLDKIKSMHPYSFDAAYSIISFTSIEPTTGRHLDPKDVFYLQCQGSVIWKVEVNNEIVEYLLEPGDLLFVPAEIYHEVFSLEPRAAISFTFDTL